jgi:hypothetical protein
LIIARAQVTFLLIHLDPFPLIRPLPPVIPVFPLQVEFWFTHLDPFLLITLALLPSYLFTKFFTENIFAQNPLVTAAACPNCNALVNIYFGDLFNVQVPPAFLIS